MFLPLVLMLLQNSEAKIDRDTFRNLISFRECLGKSQVGLCLKERALDAVNATMTTDEPFTLFDIVEIDKNPNYSFNSTQETLPDEASARSLALTDILYTQIEEFFKSRTIKFNMVSAFEGRAKKNRGNRGMMMLAMGGAAFMIAQVFMGKVAFMAGTALILAKIALFMSGIAGLKKLSGGGSGGSETSHVVYASDGHSHGGGGGGWHRSLNSDGQGVAYKAQISEASGY